MSVNNFTANSIRIGVTLEVLQPVVKVAVFLMSPSSIVAIASLLLFARLQQDSLAVLS
jgi:hypothetical protein